MSEQKTATSSDTDTKSLTRMIFVRLLLAYVSFAIVFFLPAGTLGYWQAWIYMLTFSVPLFFTLRYLIKNDPALLRRRMRYKEKQKAQKVIIALSLVCFLPAFVIPGFDFRFSWSNVPVFIVIASDCLVLLGYLITVAAFKANSYASRIIEVEKEQSVISTGPYGIVRHPMYFGVIIFYLFSPLALGSCWAIIPALLMIPILIARIVNEERELSDNLEGYNEYKKKTRYRLLPGIW